MRVAKYWLRSITFLAPTNQLPEPGLLCMIYWCCMQSRGGVLEDVLGLEDVLEDTFWSPWPWPRRSSPWPWPWPRGLKSSKIALSSARGQHYFLNSWNFVGKRQKPRRKFASTFFVFLTWSIGVAKGRGTGGPPLLITRRKWGVFVLKVAISGPHLAFLWT